MLTGRRAKHPYHQPVDVTFVQADPVSREERRKAYIRARRVIKHEQENSEEPVRAYIRNVQTFQTNELVRMKVEGSQALTLMYGQAPEMDSEVGRERNCVRARRGTP
jgi:hypothetical protein